MSAAKRVLVTGAGGFVGRHIVAALLDAGHMVIATDRHFAPPLRQRWLNRWAARLTLFENDVLDLPPQDADAIVHAAAITAGPEESGLTPEGYFRANVEPALRLLEWAGGRRVIFLSSSAVFRATAPGPVTETMIPAPLGLYAVSKLAVEYLLETLREQYGRDVVTARLSNIYGPGEVSRPTRPRVSLVARLVTEALREGHLTVWRDDPPRDWTYAPDVGRALVSLLDAPVLRHPLYHVAAEQTLTPLQIAEAIRRRLPQVTLAVREGASPEGQSLTRRGTLSSARLRDELGEIRWTPFEEGIGTVIEWQRRAEVAL
ncbi:MAG: NAD(P)-dependent oxidoreductase [Anaerolineae bacterium]